MKTNMEDKACTFVTCHFNRHGREAAAKTGAFLITSAPLIFISSASLRVINLIYPSNLI